MSFFKALAIDKMLFCENRQGDTEREISLSKKLEIFRGFGILFKDLIKNRILDKLGEKIMEFICSTTELKEAVLKINKVK